MKTIKTVLITPKYVSLIPSVEDMEEKVFYISEHNEVASHLCFCGCGHEVVTPLDSDQWILSGGKEIISLSPSIGNYNLECKSHYVIRFNKANFI